MNDTKRTKAETLAQLKQKIQHIEGFKIDAQKAPISFRIPALDQALPQGVFPMGAVHDFGCDSKNLGSTTGFISAVMAKISRDAHAILWITKTKTVFAPGLAAFGLDPSRIIFLTVHRDREALWAMEEGLRTKSLIAVVAEVTDLDLTATRRLQLAVEESGVTGFLLRLGQQTASSCYASWTIKPLPSLLDSGMPGVGFPRWNVSLNKIRNGRPGQWDIEWRAGQFHEVSHIKTPQKSFARHMGAGAS
jgi:protein ImuA